MQFSNPKTAFAYTAADTFPNGDVKKESLSNFVRRFFGSSDFSYFDFEDFKVAPNPGDADYVLSYAYIENAGSEMEERCNADVYVFRAKGIIIVMWENGESDYLA
jgi:hypothetical protein